MKKTSFIAVGFASMLCFLSSLASAADRGTADEAKALAEKAAAHLKSAGEAKALADFNATTSGFTDRDLYVFTLTSDGKLTSNPNNRALVGRDITTIPDPDGKFFGKEFVAVANEKGSGWVDYKWSNPTTKRIEKKSAYILKEGNQIIGVGIYKE